jgi:hypothetical protein
LASIGTLAKGPQCSARLKEQIMTKKPEKHADDLMVVTVSLELRAKLNPEVEDPLPFDMAEFQSTLPAGAAVDFLEKVVSAIRERRLYGFMVQEIAENAVGAGDWIKKTNADLLAEFQAHGEEQTAVKRYPLD